MMHTLPLGRFAGQSLRPSAPACRVRSPRALPAVWARRRSAVRSDGPQPRRWPADPLRHQDLCQGRQLGAGSGHPTVRAPLFRRAGLCRPLLG